jgi:hypothetical protein
MPKLNKQIKKHLLYILGIGLSFILGILGLNSLNEALDNEINGYKVQLIEREMQAQQK